jgi:hypothetical protein
MSSEWITTGTPGQHLTGPLKEKEKEVDRRKHGGERLERKGNSYDSTHGQRQPDKRKTDQNGEDSFMAPFSTRRQRTK